MIRFPITRADLEARIEVACPGWLRRAATRTDRSVTAGRTVGAARTWSQVKSVYMRLQHNKCLFCERTLAGEGYGKVEHDVEHFRPKKNVRAWPPADGGLTFPFPTGDPMPGGYFWLREHPLNYGTVCKTCNSALKSDYFPIAGGRGQAPAEPAELTATERPYLLYPIGDADEVPRQILTFRGPLAVPVTRSGHRHRRAKVMIAFFALNSRDELLRKRCEQLAALANALALINLGTSPEKAAARSDVERLGRPESRHSSCVRAACELYVSDRPGALAIFREARDYLDSLRDLPPAG